ncbi:hypothetical protein V6N11_076435 [Hibiscus sabdariffa]|uniref:Ubiquitin-like domain-containing protein n=1 Tax=Hibiscus sabdariffa TaxID=183260 RepID=A0ABR2Q690_9ROSI
MREALGRAPKRSSQPQGNRLDKHELSELVKRGSSAEDLGAGHAEATRVDGLGFSSLKIQMSEEGLVELKFRLYDGSDIGPFRYSPASTVAMLKERIVAEWPKDKKIAPKGANDIKLINAGKILENDKTVGHCKAPFDDLPKAVITMHVVVQPSVTKVKTEKKVDEAQQKNFCSCSIL